MTMSDTLFDMLCSADKFMADEGGFPRSVRQFLLGIFMLVISFGGPHAAVIAGLSFAIFNSPIVTGIVWALFAFHTLGRMGATLFDGYRNS